MTDTDFRYTTRKRKKLFLCGLFYPKLSCKKSCFNKYHHFLTLNMRLLLLKFEEHPRNA